MLIKFLIIFFSLLIIYNIYISLSREGLDNNDGYQQYNDSTAVLSEKNAANIQILKEEMDECKDIIDILTDLSNQVQTIQDQLNAMNQQNIPQNINTEDAGNSIDTNAADASIDLIK
jgi:Tfp pilus assembly protein PilO